jgi:membrane protein DedA with SNARE-associated domain
VLTAAAVALASSQPPELPGFLNLVAPYLEHYSYWAVLLLVMLEDFGVPVPGETILIAAAIFAGAGRLNVVIVGVIGFIAAVVGDNIGFAIGYFGGRALALRWGRYVFLTEERLTKAEVFFNRHGGKIIVVARFIEGLRQANGIIAGISGMRWWRFAVFNALGAALWVGTWVSLGYLAGNHINTIYHYITNYSYYALIVVAVLLTGYIVRRVLRRRRDSHQGARGVQGAREPQEAHGPQEVRELRVSSGAHEVPEAEDDDETQENSRLRRNPGIGEEPALQESLVTQNVIGSKETLVPHNASANRGNDATPASDRTLASDKTPESNGTPGKIAETHASYGDPGNQESPDTQEGA